MRELYEQFIAYSRAYADSIPAYSGGDDNLSATSTSITLVLQGICGGITYGAAVARAPSVTTALPPSKLAQPGDPANPSQFMHNADPRCTDWNSTLSLLNSDPAFLAWTREDANIPASSWTDAYKAENQAVAPVMSRFADLYEKLGKQSTDPFLADLGMLAAQYLRALVAGLPTHTLADQQLYNVFANVPGVVRWACAAAGAS